MRPRYEAHETRGIWGDIRPWCIVEQTTCGPRVVGYCSTIEDVNASVARLNATAEGLRRIGVAVAVWAGMAEAQEPLRDEIAIVRRWVEQWQEICEKWKQYALERSNALRAERAALRAERAARRKWELRLRWRAQHGPREDLFLVDRCHNHLGSVATVGLRPRRQAMLDRSRVPIAGPRGVLP